MSLRELVIHFDAYILSTWDQTALLAAQLHNLHTSVTHLLSKHPAPKSHYKTLSDLHPFRKSQTQGMQLTDENFGVLFDLGAAIVGQR